MRFQGLGDWCPGGDTGRVFTGSQRRTLLGLTFWLLKSLAISAQIGASDARGGVTELADAHRAATDLLASLEEAETLSGLRR